MIFLGDSLTQRWDASVWNRYLEPLDSLNAGVSGDRTEHLMWRMNNGNLYQQQPQVVVLFIGTNDLGHGRSVPETAENIRHVLQAVRDKLPEARVLLLGLWPRVDVPRLIGEIPAINAQLRTCDGGAVTYLEVGQYLLDPRGRLTRDVAPDGLHLSALGYSRVTPTIRSHIEQLLRN